MKIFHSFSFRAIVLSLAIVSFHIPSIALADDGSCCTDNPPPPPTGTEGNPEGAPEYYVPPVEPPPQNGGGHQPPQNGGGHQPPQHGGGFQPPQHGGGFQPPQHGGGFQPPQHGGGFHNQFNCSWNDTGSEEHWGGHSSLAECNAKHHGSCYQSCDKKDDGFHKPHQPPHYQPPVYTPPPVYIPPVYVPPVYTPPVYTPPVYVPPTNDSNLYWNQYAEEFVEDIDMSDTIYGELLTNKDFNLKPRMYGLNGYNKFLIVKAEIQFADKFSGSLKLLQGPHSANGSYSSSKKKWTFIMHEDGPTFSMHEIAKLKVIGSARIQTIKLTYRVW